MLRYSIDETNNYCRAFDEKFAGFSTAWQGTLPGESDLSADHEPTAAGDDEAHEGASAAPHGAAAGTSHGSPAEEEGHHLVHYVSWAWLVGIGLGIAMYIRGYAVADALMRFPPLRWIHTWLYRRMYFDELYSAVFVGATMALSRLSAWFDKYIVDGLVNLAGWGVKQSAVLIGLHDKYVVDGAVNGAGKLAYGVGAAVRAPQSGRIRMYVTVLMIAVAVGLAGAIIAVLSV
jgi:NADH:ubiquinone oxidoreductase subunit 5 (subunit L)/multisubunit Na+/H+ antiporter MnhA subunit